MTARSTDTELGELYYPKFPYGEDLYVFVCRDGTFRFQSENFAYVAADNVVYVDDWV